MLTTIRRLGSDRAVCLPKNFLDSLFISENDSVEVFIENESIVIQKAARTRRSKLNLEEPLERFYQKPILEILADDDLYAPTEYDWGKPIGREAW